MTLRDMIERALSIINLYFFHCVPPTPNLHSFPTRRSSDLNILFIVGDDMGYADEGFQGCQDIPTPHLDALAKARCGVGMSRSEEHTSELQSHHDLVCRLLLEKKKKKPKNSQHTNKLKQHTT